MTELNEKRKRFDTVMERLRIAMEEKLGKKVDMKVIAYAMNIQPASLSGYKFKGELPLRKINAVCLEWNIDIWSIL